MTAIGAPSGGGVGRGRTHVSRSAVGAANPYCAAAGARRRAAGRRVRRVDGGTSR